MSRPVPDPFWVPQAWGMKYLLPEWRKRRDVKKVPGWDRLEDRLRSVPLTQGAMGALTGKTERHYRNLELRGGTGFSPEFAADVARLLGLNVAQTSALYRWIRQDDPTAAGLHAHVSAPLRRLLEELPHGAYYSNRLWDIVAYNRLAALHWPWITEPGANIMLWALGRRSGSRAMLAQYGERWVRPMVAQLRMSYLADPHNPRLLGLISTVCTNPIVRRVWEQDIDLRLHAQGEVRPMWLPTLAKGRPVDIQILSLTPQGSDLRLVMGMPADRTLREPLPPAVGNA